MSASYTTEATRYPDTRRHATVPAVDRAHLIDRKHEVVAAIARLRRRIDHVRATDAGDRNSRRRLARREADPDRLADEEHRLRASIDRTPG
jgi:hypothetical protein